jgi:hypothetical protein
VSIEGEFPEAVIVAVSQFGMGFCGVVYVARVLVLGGGGG